MSIDAAIGVDPESGASIETNKDDYQPGEIVHLEGHGWTPGETVSLAMTEDPNTHDDVYQEVQADGDGKFSIHFYDVQQHDLGVTFTLTATGQTSGSVATAVFTDNIPAGLITVTLDNAASVTVSPGATISLEVTARVSTATGGPGNWNSTGWVLTTSLTTPSGKLSHCVDTEDAPGITPSGTDYHRTLDITAPVNPGTYHLWVALDEDDGVGANACGGPLGQSVKKSFENVVTVGAADEAPTAVITAPTEADEGSTIPLSGSNSTDDGTVDSYQWSIVSFDNPDGGTCEFAGGGATATGVTTSVECDDNGSLVIGLVVTDDDDLSSTPAEATITVNNVNPTVVIAPDSRTIDEGGSAAYTATITDPGSNDTHTTFSWTSTIGVCTLDAGATNISASFTCTDNGTGTVKLEVTDDDNGTGDDTAGLTVNNVAPTVVISPGSRTIDEGSSASYTATVTDPGSSDTHTFDWTTTVGTCTLDAGSTKTSATFSCTDDGTGIVKLVVTDDDGDSGEDTAGLTVDNVPPSVTLTSPTMAGSLFSLLSGPVPATATYTDPGTPDTHECRLELAGVMSATGPYSPVSGGNCSGSILPPEAGVYTLTVRVRDDDGGEGTASIMIVVYDPSAGFVTGGGWFYSEGDVPGTELAGKATFGFVSKYKKGASIPEGNTEFVFHAGGLNFHSSSYQFLIVNQAGTNSQFKGTGKINGLGSYTFMIWATDGGTTGDDTFRIQITDNNNGGTVVFDNGVEQAITGSIVIHTGGKK